MVGKPQPLPQIRRALIQEILRQLKIAQAAIEAALEGITSADAARRLTRQRAEIARVLNVFRSAVDAEMLTSASSVWSGGIESIADQLGLALAPRIDPRALLQIEKFMTGKIADISRVTLDKINTALTQQLLGVRSLSETVTEIQNILGGVPRQRAMTIAYTEIGRAYSAAQYQAMLKQSLILPGLRKDWIKSGKLHPRPGHVLAAQQEPILVEEHFVLVDLRTGETEQALYPRDPNLSAFNSINCGCMMRAVPPSIKDIFSRPLTHVVNAAGQLVPR